MADADSDIPPDRSPRRIRWWPMVAGDLVVLVVVWAFVTEWSGIWGSHPAYAITLVVLLAAAVATTLVALLRAPKQRTPRATWLLRIGLVVTAAAVMALVVYLRPMSAEQVAVDAMADGAGVDVQVSRDRIRLVPDQPSATGLVFYPGALVDPRAYVNILRPVAEAGFTVVIVKFPYNLAIVGRGAAADHIGRDDGITSWAVGGHSLGGAMAASFAEDQRDELDGLLLWAAYPVRDMSDRQGLAVLTVTGSDDGVIDRERLAAAPDELPADADFVVVPGANHATFGDYGAQGGDRPATRPKDAGQADIQAATIAFLTALESTP